MNKTAIKNFAIGARNKLITDIQYRTGLMGITAEGIKNALPQSTPNMEFYDIGTAQPYSITGETIRQRQKLVETIRRKEADSDYPTAYKYILEEVAYTWFNRLIAIRFMEVNDYLPSHIRVLSSESGKVEPDLVTTPFDAELDFTHDEEETILRLKNENALDELFRLLFIKQCNALNEILPALFEKTNDYTELLLNLSVVDQDGVVYHLIHDIDEDDFNIEKGGQVEIIGWLYQYYNTEPKNAAFAKNGKITKEEIPAVTQLFTPDWIVRYMVQNSLGRLFIDKRKNEGVFADGRGLDEMTWDEVEEKRIATEKHLAEQMEWKYYLPEAAQTKEVREQLDKIQQQSAYKDVRDIKVIDPCMGSGHILVYAFDVLMQMYEDAGYSQRDAVKSILEHNLYGLDIDDRAYQLAYFSVMMKARQYNRRILNGETTCHVYAIQESNNINRAHLKYFGAGMDDLEANTARVQLEGLLDTLRDAKEYGSILKVENYNWELLRRFVSAADAGTQISMDSVGLDETVKKLTTLVSIGEILAQKYDVVVTNPPYMGSKQGMNAALKKYLQKEYPASKSDLYCVFMDMAIRASKPCRYIAVINQHGWMFLSSFAKFRANLIVNQSIINMIHLGTHAFEDIGGEVVQTTAFVLYNRYVDYNGRYIRLTEYHDAAEKETVELKVASGHECSNAYIFQMSYFGYLPDALIGYWISKKVIDIFNREKCLADIAKPRQGLSTSDNDRFLRLWYETNIHNIGFGFTSRESAKESGLKWFPYNKGGEYRKWYGNNNYVINWQYDGAELRAWADYLNTHFTSMGRLVSQEFYFKKGITWSGVGATRFGVRCYSEGMLFDVGANGLFVDDALYYYLAGFLNTKIADDMIKILNPTINTGSGTVGKLPIIIDQNARSEIANLVRDNIASAKRSWDSYETSWDFNTHPLVPSSASLSLQCCGDGKKNYLSDYFMQWEKECSEHFCATKENEERLNQIFISIYGLQSEIDSSVLDKDITICKANLLSDVKSLLSYAVGCMFGRYSLDTEGLAYAGGDWDKSKYKTFLPVEDGILPITDEEYLEDDIVTRLCSWLKVVYGEDTLEENLDFIAKALGNRGNSSREIIRNYFLKDFFKDHCQTYSVTGSGKRPIYWLFDSGKQDGFKALIYLHRYTPDTIGNLRVDYLHKMQRVYESEIGRMQDMIDHSTNTREVAAATKRKEKLQKQLKECRDYDETIAHLALSRIELDLDDGVKVNYEKIQTASDGKKYPVLAKI